MSVNDASARFAILRVRLEIARLVTAPSATIFAPRNFGNRGTRQRSGWTEMLRYVTAWRTGESCRRLAADGALDRKKPFHILLTELGASPVVEVVGKCQRFETRVGTWSA